jgi:hypothetical protein
MKESIPPRQERESRRNESFTKSVRFNLIKLCAVLFASDWHPGDTFERDGLSKGSAAPVVTPTMQPEVAPPTPKPAELVAQGNKAPDPTRCKDCVYRERCFRILKFWISLTGKTCNQSRRRRA